MSPDKTTELSAYPSATMALDTEAPPWSHLQMKFWDRTAGPGFIKTPGVAFVPILGHFIVGRGSFISMKRYYFGIFEGENDTV